MEMEKRFLIMIERPASPADGIPPGTMEFYGFRDEARPAALRSINLSHDKQRNVHIIDLCAKGSVVNGSVIVPADLVKLHDYNKFAAFKAVCEQLEAIDKELVRDVARLMREMQEPKPEPEEMMVKATAEKLKKIMDDKRAKKREATVDSVANYNGRVQLW